jgi:hypothetical protein
MATLVRALCMRDTYGKAVKIPRRKVLSGRRHRQLLSLPQRRRRLHSLNSLRSARANGLSLLPPGGFGLRKLLQPLRLGH